jgi:hypothetical protein
MTNENREYEKYVGNITEALLRAHGLETIKVDHDVQVQGLSRSHQVDVYWEYRLAGVLHRVIINCKRYRNTVEVTDVLTLGGVLADIPGVIGLIVTTVGFQKGAIEYAQTHGIGLKIIRPPEDSDWEGRLREIHLNIRIDIPVLLSCSTQIDSDWIKANIPDSPIAGTLLDASLAKVRDLDTGQVADMNALWNRAREENPTEAGHECAGTLYWKNAMLESPDTPALKVNSMTFTWKVEMGQQPITTIIKSEPAAIVRDAIAGTLLFVDPNGRVSGDVEQELGWKR